MVLLGFYRVLPVPVGLLLGFFFGYRVLGVLYRDVVSVTRAETSGHEKRATLEPMKRLDVALSKQMTNVFLFYFILFFFLKIKEQSLKTKKIKTKNKRTKRNDQFSNERNQF